MVITNPFHQVLNCYLLCSQFIPQVPNLFPVVLNFLCFLREKIHFFLIAQIDKFTAKQNQYEMTGKAKGDPHPAQPRNITT
jgi:hypothetical protein